MFTQIHEPFVEPHKKEECLEYTEIVDLLIAAGYFRARITTVTPFDKVVGGLCWCIQCSGEGVDADILFEENSSIGQRIRLSERIVTGLKKMNCPIPLQPHQIQGNDFPALKPILEWLIQKYFETKQATFSLLRKYSLLQYDVYAHPITWNMSASNSPLLNLNQYYLPQRKYQSTNQIDSEDARVQSCLLEFGERENNRTTTINPISNLLEEKFSSSDDGKSDVKMLSSFERKYRAAQKAAISELEKNVEERRTREETLLETMKNADSCPSTTSVEKIVELQVHEIHQATAEYEMLAEETKKIMTMQNQGSAHELDQTIILRRQKHSLEKQLYDLKTQHSSTEKKRNETNETFLKTKKEFEKKQQYNQKIKDEINKFVQMEEQCETKEDLAKLQGLVMLNESLIDQEKQFKRNCREQLAQLQETNSKLINSQSKEETQKLAEIEQVYEDMTNKYNSMRKLLATKAQEISMIRRKIDDVPTRRELIQYDRRFIELYDEVALKLDETRKYFSTYNTLDDTFKFIEKEVSLINSISDAFSNAMKTKSSKEAFLKKFSEIITNVENSLTKQKASLLEKTKEVDSLDSKYQLLVEKQRLYLKSIKEFREECIKNEKLTMKVK